jgi:hypothetical protein
MWTQPEYIYLYIKNLFHGLLPADMIERSTPNHQLVSQYSQTPQVHRHIVLFSFQYLRSSVVKCSTIGLSPLIANRSPPKIAKLANAMRDDNVFRFNVSMSDTSFVQIPDSLCYLS